MSPVSRLTCACGHTLKASHLIVGKIASPTIQEGVLACTVYMACCADVDFHVYLYLTCLVVCLAHLFGSRLSNEIPDPADELVDRCRNMDASCPFLVADVGPCCFIF